MRKVVSVAEKMLLLFLLKIGSFLHPKFYAHLYIQIKLKNSSSVLNVMFHLIERNIWASSWKRHKGNWFLTVLYSYIWFCVIFTYLTRVINFVLVSSLLILNIFHTLI